MITERCTHCRFFSSAVGICDYIGVMNHSRGCPTGDECTKFDDGKRTRQVNIPAPNAAEAKTRTPAQERSAERFRRWYQAHRAESAEKTRKDRAKDPEKYRSYQRDYYAKHREKIRAYQNEYYAKRRAGNS